MRGVRFIGGLVTSAALLATSLGVGFGLFYTSGAESLDENADVRVDDIEENYALKDSNQSSGYYDVYFFPQEQAAARPERCERILARQHGPPRRCGGAERR